MKDRYLFKAKNTIGKWETGLLTDTFKIKDHTKFKKSVVIDESTICACTGLKDCEGNLIFENDELYVDYEYCDKIMIVEHDELNPCFVLQSPTNKYMREYDFIKANMMKIKLTGKNIHDKSIPTGSTENK